MDKYILVTWPEVQMMMEEDWFDECILMNDTNHLEEIGSSAYFVPEERHNQFYKIDEIDCIMDNGTIPDPFE